MKPCFSNDVCNFINQIQPALSQYSGISNLEKKGFTVKPTDAAVFLIFYREFGKWNIILTKRSKKVRSHKSEISLPGGTKDIKDLRLIDTAIREVKEEIGLYEKEIHIVGQMHPVYTKTGYKISPFVGVVSGQVKFAIDKSEVYELIKFPLSELYDDAINKKELKMNDGFVEVVSTYSYQGYFIFGATAKILSEIKMLLMGV